MGRIPVDVLVANDEYARESGSDDCSINETMFIDVPCRFLVESLELEWRGVEGSWFDKGGRLIAFDPSVNARGPRVLLFRRDVLVKWLNANGLTVLWTLLGEKETVGGPMDDRSYFGRTEMNGAYLLKGDVVDGGMRADFVPR